MKNDQDKTKEQLITELGKMRQQATKLKASETERKQVEEELKENEERFHSIIKNTQAGYFRIGRDGCFQQVNSAWLKMHRYLSEEEIIGRHFSLTQVNVGLEQAQKVVERLLRGYPVPTGEFTRLCKDGSIGYHTFNVTSVESKGEVIGLEGFLIDATERKQAEEERERLIQELQETLAEVNTLSGLLPICTWCRKPRDDKGYWESVEEYIGARTTAEFSHGICPECLEKSLVLEDDK
ncbi:PAS domain S-box protein [Chloroflexota bacterium]